MAGNFNQPSANPNSPAGAPNPQDNPQMPEHRLKDLETKLRNLELQNVQLRTTLNHVNAPQQTQNQQTQPPEQTFDPAVQSAIDSLVDAKLRPITTQYQNALGSLHDQIDDTKFSQRYGGEKFKPYMDKVQQVRQEHLAQNRFISREEALRLVFFEAEGKKAQPAKIEPIQQPQWDKNLGNFVHPGTTEPWFPGQPVKTPAPMPIEATPQTVQTSVNPQTPMQTPQTGVTTYQQPAPYQQSVVNQTQNLQTQQSQPFFQPEFGQQNQPTAQNQLPPQQVPVQNNFQVPQLPDVSPNPVGNFQDPSNIELGLDSSPDQLDAWEQRYGDQPL